MSTNLSEMKVLVTGGTRGLGRSLGLEFARAGAAVFLTHRWGSVDEEELRAEFSQDGLPEPTIVESDVSDPQDMRALMERMRDEAGGVDAIFSNVAFAQATGSGLDALKKSVLDLSLGYSAWPLVSLVQAAVEVTGRYPRYLVGISSDGGEVCHPGYDFAGASKSVMETLSRYLALRLKPHGVRVNVLRPGFLDTESARQTFGEETLQRVQEQFGDMFLDAGAVARVGVALCSGMMDAVTGQTIVVDEGWSLVSPITLLGGDGAPGPFPEEEA